MHRVAIVAPDFAPSSLPNAQRIRFLANHLLEFGWRPIVITVDPSYYEVPIDPENEHLLDSSLEIIRTAALPIQASRRVGLGDIGIRCLAYHWQVLSKLCRQNMIDLIFLSTPATYPLILGRLIHMRYKVPYVIDYQDPWVTDYYWKLPRANWPPKWPLVYALARILEPFALKNVSHISGVSKGTVASVIARYPWLSQQRTVELPLGGEEADFDYLRKNRRTNVIFDPSDNVLHLSYVGVIGSFMLPPLRALLAAFRLGLQHNPEVFQRTRLHFVGTSYSASSRDDYQVLPLAHDIGIADFVDEHPRRVSYLESLQLMLDSHSLLVVGSTEPHYTASKVFPYILAHHPILAVCHEKSTVVTILETTRAGEIVTFSEQQPVDTKILEITKCLTHMLMLPRDFHPPVVWEEFEPYTTRTIAQRLAGLFDAVLRNNSHDQWGEV